MPDLALLADNPCLQATALTSDQRRQVLFNSIGRTFTRLGAGIARAEPGWRQWAGFGGRLIFEVHIQTCISVAPMMGATKCEMRMAGE